MSVLKQFLAQAKRSPVKGIVSGNQSADMDSAISALAYAFFSTRHADPVVPIINVPRHDFRLRRDIVEWLAKFGVAEDDLWFADDLEALVAPSPRSVPLHLVDHCNLQGPEIIALVGAHKLSVVSIIDHHADEKVFIDANPRVIGAAGSCSSRVWHYWHSVLGAEAEVPEIVELLMAPLLIDTGNMTQKVEDVDRQALAEYDEILARPTTRSVVDSVAAIRSDIYPKLKSAKKDVSGFSFEDILRKDYKQNTFGDYTIGFSSIGKSFEWIRKTFNDADIVGDLDGLATKLGLDYVIMTCSYSDKTTGEHRRDFGEYHAGGKPLDWTHAIDVLRLAPYPEVSLPRVDVWHQHDVNATRKTVVPVVHDTVLKYQK
ncbi:hypothetical protein DIURU_000234 [Diutina rugosa]|uniref:DHHA2 domain-containing protein n=1 Tax=Diutina rugosa TaxID=5481 RepID=A0A642UYK2_DIURU|nr:uncharacterized protein DIURU_000234 [Diutina rugosa]KAA8908265.1 hypothetical protein DIURU_000234 [Diutina rugosa]